MGKYIRQRQPLLGGWSVCFPLKTTCHAGLVAPPVLCPGRLVAAGGGPAGSCLPCPDSLSLTPDLPVSGCHLLGRWQTGNTFPWAVPRLAQLCPGCP